MSPSFFRCLRAGKKKKRAGLNGKPQPAKPDFRQHDESADGCPLFKMTLTSGIHASQNYGEKRDKIVIGEIAE